MRNLRITCCVIGDKVIITLTMEPEMKNTPKKKKNPSKKLTTSTYNLGRTN